MYIYILIKCLWTSWISEDLGQHLPWMCVGSGLPSIWMSHLVQTKKCPPKNHRPHRFKIPKVVNACRKTEVLREEAGQLGSSAGLSWWQVSLGMTIFFLHTRTSNPYSTGETVYLIVPLLQVLSLFHSFLYLSSFVAFIMCIFIVNDWYYFLLLLFLLLLSSLLVVLVLLLVVVLFFIIVFITCNIIVYTYY